MGTAMDFTFSSRAGSSAQVQQYLPPCTQVPVDRFASKSADTPQLYLSVRFGKRNFAGPESFHYWKYAQSCTSKSSWFPSTSTNGKAAALSAGNDRLGWYLHIPVPNGTFHEFHGLGMIPARKTAETAAQATQWHPGNGMNRSLSNAGRGMSRRTMAVTTQGPFTHHQLGQVVSCGIRTLAPVVTSPGRQYYFQVQRISLLPLRISLLWVRGFSATFPANETNFLCWQDQADKTGLFSHCFLEYLGNDRAAR